MSSRVKAITITVCVPYNGGPLKCISEVDGVMDTNWVTNLEPARTVSLSGNKIAITNDNSDLMHGEIGVYSFTTIGHDQFVSLDGLQLCTFGSQYGEEYTLTCTDDYTANPIYWFTLNGRPDYAARRMSALSGMRTGKNEYMISLTGDMFGPYVSANARDNYLNHFSTDGVTLCGVTANKDAYCAYSGYPDNPVFTQLDPSIDYFRIAVQDHLIFIVDYSRDIYYSSNPPGSWIFLGNNADSVSASSY